jgi:hypothetical protein
MVHRGPVAGPNFRRDHPLIFGEIHFHQNVLIIDGAGCRQVDVGGHFDDHVRLDVPAFFELARSGLVFRIAFGRTGVDPGDQGGDIGGGEPSVVGEMSVAVFGKPWRHLARRHCRLDALRPGTRFRVSEQRHRRDFAGTMAFLTILLKNRKNVFVKGHR